MTRKGTRKGDILLFLVSGPPSRAYRRFQAQPLRRSRYPLGDLVCWAEPYSIIRFTLPHCQAALRFALLLCAPLFPQLPAEFATRSSASKHRPRIASIRSASPRLRVISPWIARTAKYHQPHPSSPSRLSRRGGQAVVKQFFASGRKLHLAIPRGLARLTD